MEVPGIDSKYYCDFQNLIMKQIPSLSVALVCLALWTIVPNERELPSLTGSEIMLIAV